MNLSKSSTELFKCLKAYDDYTSQHSLSVCQLAYYQATLDHYLPNGKKIRFSELMKDSGISLDVFSRATLLHDIGKVTLPKDVLLKSGALTAEERNIVMSHEKASHNILLSQGLEMEASIAGQHHNYAKSKKECKFYIPDLRIKVAASDLVHLADVEDACSNQRCYRPGFSHLKTMGILVDHAKSGQISPELTCLWVKSEIKRLFRDIVISTWDDLKNLWQIFRFIYEEWAKMKECTA